MSLENRVIFGGLAATSCLASAIQDGFDRMASAAPIDDTGPAAVARLAAALRRERLARQAVEEERNMLIEELNQARRALASRPLPRPRRQA
ncbi:hypothetical protein LH400_22515 [Aurantimonas sp. VKM B-3413]|nr:hypothetical protein [Aurantimonas sp. VKM B-3413]